MPDSDKLVSIVMPVYNAGAYLDQAVLSARRQTYERLQIVCVNDGSTDGSLEVMRRHAAEDPRVKVVDKPNEGYGAAMNRGIGESQGAWVSILEPDDWMEPGMVAEMVALAERLEAGGSGPVDMVKTPFWAIADPGTPRERRLNCSYRVQVRPRRNPCDLHDLAGLLPGAHPSIWSALYRREFLDRCNIRFLPIPGAGWADNPFFMETLCQARRIAYLDKPFYCYRMESREKTVAFHRDQPLVPFERWHQMLDVMERTGMDADPVLLRAHYSRGFTYMGGVLEQHKVDEPAIRQACTDMFARMRPELVEVDARVTPAMVALYAELSGRRPRPASRARYALCLVRRALDELRANGPGEVLARVGRLAGSSRSRAGR